MTDNDLNPHKPFDVNFFICCVNAICYYSKRKKVNYQKFSDKNAVALQRYRIIYFKKNYMIV